MTCRKRTGISLLGLPLLIASCIKEDEDPAGMDSPSTITFENVLDSKPLVQSGAFQNKSSSPLIMLGEIITFRFSAARGQAISFDTMYRWSSDLFFAPDNLGKSLNQEDGTTIQGDVSSQVKLWDDGVDVTVIGYISSSIA